MEAELVGFSFAVKEKEAWYIAVKDDREEALKMLSIFKPLFEDEKILKVGQNIKYDMEVLQNYGITVKGRLFDTMLAHYIIQPELHHGMDYLAEVYLCYQTVHIEELIGPKGKGQKNMRDLPPEAVYAYACEDADITLRLYHIPTKTKRGRRRRFVLANRDAPSFQSLADMEQTGVCLDTEALKRGLPYLQRTASPL